MNVRSVEPMNLIPSGPVLNYSSLHPHIWISNSNVCINHETLLPRKHGHPPHREKHLCVPPTVARCLSATRKPDHIGRTSRHLNVEHYFIMGKSMESHHANWLLKFVPPYVNVCETGIHTHCLVEGHKTFFSNVVAGNRQSRRQKRYQISWTAWRTEIVLCKLNNSIVW